ncbi:MAG: flagellar motor switch protein FliN, partial [Eubacteriales bacterium]
NEVAGNNARAIAIKRPVKAIRQPQFDSFDDMLDDNTESQKEKNTEMLNFRLINDIPLQVTVELGTAKKNLNTVLNFTTGSIIVLDKQAGDLVEVIVNGKKIARGEVVVVDENYGVRITELIK